FDASKILVQSDGEIIVAGGAVLRLNSNGSRDTSFGSNGEEHAVGGADFAIQTDGKIVVVGTFGNDEVVTRLKSDGSVGTDFGTGGNVILNFGGPSRGIGVAIQPEDGYIVVTGEVGFLTVARLTPSGSPDGSFGIDNPGDTALVSPGLEIAAVSVFATTGV